MNPVKNYFVVLLAACCLAGCAHVQVRSRTAKQLMPLIKSHYAALKKQAATDELEPVPTTRLETLRGLFVELKGSPAEIYSKNKDLWTHSCDAALARVDQLTKAWTARSLAEVHAALKNLGDIADEAHQTFGVDHR